jgi:hypothetical protein
MSGHALANFDENTCFCATPFSIKFVTPVYAAAFAIFTETGPSLFEAILSGTVVESFTETDLKGTTNNRIGFQDILFDEIRVTRISTVSTVIDTIQFDHKFVDIKPKDDQNKINLCQKKPFPVAILSSATFDAPAEVDPDTVTLADASVKRVGKDKLPWTDTKDVNGDGFADLTVKILTEELALESGDTEAELKALKFDLTEIKQKDAVEITRYMCSRAPEE